MATRRQNHSSSQSLSMLEKSQRKQHINNEHRTNFRAGYIQINEEYLHKTGIRGRKKNLLYCFVALLLTMAIANIAITGLLMAVLQLTPFGLQSLEFILGGTLLRFLKDSTLPNITLISGQLGSRARGGLVFSTDQNMIHLGTDEGSFISVNEKDTTFVTDGLTFMTQSGDVIFSTDPEVEWSFPQQPKNLLTESVEATMMKSRTKWNDIVLESFTKLSVKGEEGVRTEELMDKIHVTSGKGINFSAKKGNLTFEASDGNIFFTKRAFRPAKIETKVDINMSNATLVAYKICVCTLSGKIFAVPTTSNCLSPADACNE